MKSKVFLAICISVFAAYTITCADKDIKINDKQSDQSTQLNPDSEITQPEPIDQVFKSLQNRLRFSPWSKLHSFDSFFDRMSLFEESAFNDYNFKKSSSIHETESEFIVEVELPGVKKEDIKVNLKNETLEVQGQRRSYHSGNDKLTGTVRGSFYKKFSLPGGVIEDQVKASYSNGLLVVTLGKKKDLASKEIMIE